MPCFDFTFQKWKTYVKQLSPYILYIFKFYYNFFLNNLYVYCKVAFLTWYVSVIDDDVALQFSFIMMNQILSCVLNYWWIVKSFDI